MGDTSTSFVSGETVRRAISDFQSFAGLNPTGKTNLLLIVSLTLFYRIVVGELDEETSIWMSKPRCGVPDIIHEGHSTRRKRNANKKGNIIINIDQRLFCAFVCSCYFTFNAYS